MSYTSKKQENDFDLIPDGVYVAVAEKVEEKDNFDGSEKILQIQWRLTNNRIMFDKIHKDKKFPDDYNHYKVSNILSAVKGGDCDTTDELIKEIQGKKATLTISISTYNGKQFNRVDVYDVVADEGHIDTEDLPF